MKYADVPNDSTLTPLLILLCDIVLPVSDHIAFVLYSCDSTCQSERTLL